MTALEVVLEVAPDTPFIFLSGTLGEERAIEALQRGAYDYVLKTNMARLAPAARRALNEAETRRTRLRLEQQLRDIVVTSQDWIWEHDPRRPLHLLQRFGARHPRLCARGDARHPRLAVRPPRGPGGARLRHAHAGSQPAHRHQPAGPLAASQWQLPLAGTKHAGAAGRANGQVTGYRGSERDFTDRRRQEKRISRLTRVLKMLSGVNGAMVRIRQRREILVEACRLATTVGGYASAMVALIEPGTRTARPAAWSGSVDQQLIQQLTYSIAESAEDDAASSAASCAAACRWSVTTCSRWRCRWPRAPRCSTGVFAASWRCRLLVDRTPVGALMLTSYDVGVVGDEELRMLRELVANLSFGLQYLHKEDEIRFLSYFDPLTSLAKRGLFCERVVRALEPRIGRRGTPAVAVLDIEHLSTINDSFGRHAGDLLLQQVADRMKRHFDSTELLAHFGAGTFGVIMEAAGDEDEAFHWMREQIMDVFRAPFTVDARGIPVDVKCGFARYPDNGNDANALVQNAEAALRGAKSTRREIPAPSPRAVRRGGLAHDHGASPARRGRTAGLRAPLPAQVRRAHGRDARPGSAAALARSGSRPRDAGRVPLADGIERTHRAAGRLDPAPGVGRPAPLARRGLRARAASP